MSRAIATKNNAGQGDLFVEGEFCPVNGGVFQVSSIKLVCPGFVTLRTSFQIQTPGPLNFQGYVVQNSLMW